MSNVIDTRVTHPYYSPEDVFLIPPGAINVVADEDIYALRFSAADLTGALNGAVSAKSTGEYACAILFQDDDDNLLNGSLIFSSGKAAVSAAGAENVGAVYGNQLTLGTTDNVALTGSLSATAKSEIAALAAGVYADSEVLSPLALSVSVAASGGTDAEAYGFLGDLSADEITDKFKLAVSAKSGDGVAVAGGVEEDFNGDTLSGSFSVSADASKGTDAIAYGFRTMLHGISSFGDKFKLTVKAKCGSGNAYAAMSGGLDAESGLLAGTIAVSSDAAKGIDAEAYGFYDDLDGLDGFSEKLKFTVTAKAGSGAAAAYAFNEADFAAAGGILAGTVTVTADASKGTDGTACGTNGTAGNLAGISGKFKLTVTAKAGSGTATAHGFEAISAIGGTLAGTVTVTADASRGTDSVACGVYDTASGIQGTDDKFKLTVTAKAGSGDATAEGFYTLGIAEGLGGTVTVAAESKTGSARAVGGELSSTDAFTTRSGGLLTVTAKSKAADTDSSAFGMFGETGAVELGGILAVSASGPISSAAGVSATGALTGSVSGSIAAVGGTSATGISAGADSDLTVSGAVYAGTKGNAASIAKSLAKLAGTGKSAAGANKNSARAIVLGDDSALTLADGGIVIGSVTLGDASTLNLSTGSQLYGDIDMGTNGELNITVDGTLAKTAMVTLASDGAGVFSPTSGVNLTVTAVTDTRAGSYVLLAGSDLSELSDVDFNSLFDLVDFDTRGFDVAWNLDLSGKTDKLTLIVTESPVVQMRIADSGGADLLSASSSLLAVEDASGATGLKNAFLA